MSFDSTKPVNNSKIVATELRNQFNGLKDIIDAQQQVIDAQQVQITAQQQQLGAQAAQITTLQTQSTAQQQELAAQQAQLTAQAWLLNQLNIPQLNHDNEGAWSMGYIGTLPALWQVWVRSDLNNDWSNTASYTPPTFPVNDIGLMPPGAQWWQIKVCGSDGSSTITPFSNVISVGTGN